MHIEPLNLPNGCFFGYPNLEFTAFSEIATKLDSVIAVVNKMAPAKENNLAESLSILLQTWKKEAEDLLEHPEDFHGASKETCKAVSHSLLKCYAEISEILCE